MRSLQAVCRVCASNNFHEWRTAKDFNQGKSEELFTYRICDDCGSIFLDPVPHNLKEFYGLDYGPYAIKGSKKQNFNFRYLENSKLEIVKRYAPSGRLVEIGPASGGFLLAANQDGYDVLGIEQDEGCVKYIKDVLSLDVRCSEKPAEELLLLADSCDVIVAWHVIEHLTDLDGLVHSASTALRKPTGMIIVSTPNPEALSFRLFGRYWVHLDAPRHLTLMPLSALDLLMAAHGLERVACIYDDSVGLLQNRTGWQGSLKNLSRQKKIRPLLLAKLFGRMLAMLMSLFDRIKGNGAAYTAIYKHRPLLPEGRQ